MTGSLITLITKNKQHSPGVRCKLYTFLNPYSYLIARRNLAVFREFQIHLDGISLVLAMRAFGYSFLRKSFDMTSLAATVFQQASEEGWKIYFIGGEPGIAQAAAGIFKIEYPDLQISGTHHGFLNKDSDLERVTQQILSEAPDIVVCGMGTPHQENFLVNLKHSGWVGTGYTCGGFLHQTAKSGVQYYPKFVDKFNIRWIYRIYDEPKLAKRYLLHYPAAAFYLLLDILKETKQKK